MSSPSRPRWFRFSLRSMLLVMTALCCYLAWESSIVRTRRAVLNEVRGNAAFQVTSADEWQGRYPHDLPVKVPLIRRWLGDQAIQEIFIMRYYQTFSEEQLARFQTAFPEAAVREVYPEPCHPGCFPHGTLVETANGPRPIESIEVGESMNIVLPSGQTGIAQVQSIFATENWLWRIETADGMLLTTKSQPLCTTLDQSILAGDVRPGDSILRYTSGESCFVKVLAVTPTNRTEQVVNLVLGNCEIFVAGGFLARSKPPPQTAE